ncbi:matrixin family metalloprotease [Alkanindiges sp. WGS2144]|uniref:matrixin family metalloprotease n=1 Tax=Alkanindiges sp. WGS2144 TaxID=3366808 RepID=UPI003752E8C1
MRIWIPFVVLLIALIYLQQSGHSSHRSTYSARLAISQLAHPFDSRVRYRVGQVDVQFGLSQSEVIELARQAAEIWHQGTGKQLFIYDPAASLSINLYFDARQLESNLRHVEQQQLEQQLASQQSHNSNYQQQKRQLEQQRQQLDDREAEFKAQLAHYNRKVQAWNTLGNLDDFNRRQLEQQKQLLDTEKQHILNAIDHYNQQVNALNQTVEQLNHQSEQYNQTLSRYQARFVPRQFEKGVYDGQQINIYEFSTPADLRLTIAHELGHALGLSHNNDPHALMYPVLKQQDVENFRLTAADLSLLSSR